MTLTQDKTLKNRDSSSSPSEIVRRVKTPASNVMSFGHGILWKGTQQTHWENKTPPSHIEREAASCGYHHDCHDKPDDCKTPQNKADTDTKNIEYIASLCDMR